jgi:hypothetical protein
LKKISVDYVFFSDLSSLTHYCDGQVAGGYSENHPPVKANLRRTTVTARVPACTGSDPSHIGNFIEVFRTEATGSEFWPQKCRVQDSRLKGSGES